MLVENYYEFLANVHCRNTSGNIKKTDGSSIAVDTGTVGFVELFRNMSIICGTGTKPVEFTDFSLDTEVPSAVIPRGNGQIIGNTNFVRDGKKISVQISFPITNDSSNPVTIKEIGLMKKVYNSTTAITNTSIMFAREVLDKPIVVPAKSGTTINMEVVLQ